MSDSKDVQDFDSTTYLNTDLDLKSLTDLRPLIKVLEENGLFALHVEQSSDDGEWFACLEHDGHDQTDPDTTINRILDVIEKLSEDMLQIWDSCTQREFNIGYQCGDHPRWVQHHVSTSTLQRIAAVGGSIGLTLYACEDEN